jgi:uncharacterized protein with HEPN domain
MPHDPRAWLWDVREAAAAIAEFTAGMDAAAYAENRLVRSAVERQFEIIGEALNRLSRDAPALAARIPDLAAIVAFRNTLPLPPLAEQRRIVAKVEELMALLDRLEAARTAREATRDRLTAASLARLTAPDTEASSADFPTMPTPASPSPRSPPSPPAPTRSNPSARPSSTSPSAANWWHRTRPTNRRRSC